MKLYNVAAYNSLTWEYETKLVVAESSQSARKKMLKYNCYHRAEAIEITKVDGYKIILEEISTEKPIPPPTRFIKDGAHPKREI